MAIQRRPFLTAAGVVAAGLGGCLSSDEGGNAAPEIAGTTLTLTTTTSTYDTGLLDDLNAPFEDRYGVTVNTISQGTGAALETGRAGDSDVVMVHARSLEDEFLEEGYGVNRRDLMFNDFVVVGGSDDPAGIAGGDDAAEAFETIAEAESTFISRGDDSGTHAKELAIWEEAGIDRGGDWYLEAGDGMGPVLTQSDQQGAYTLADRGTYLSMQNELDLEILVEGPIEGGSELLANPYGIVAVNPAVHDTVEYDLAMAYIGYLTSLEGQERIEEYTVEDEQLFFPESLSENPNFRQYVPEGWSDDDGA
ncbi:substrate-binding domain-containing protein [Natrononativus amylolyticus]|uniref:substrate-binding domain-containing protein n=1 Tax=Natrononativus amylolyticus TaxID=2963434 RepID=UPI0020CE84A4|nr:substrate-binding domain-containing protein [Natrononativus amylolyticus]